MSEVSIKFNQASFRISAAKLGQLPEDIGAEVAFIGRSNAGKSSSLNTLTNQKQLAKVSRTPGRTQLINVFDIDNNHRLIDLPGYGYAKVPEKVKKDWMTLVDSYLRNRDSLKGLVLVMDIRHPLQEMDWNFLSWTKECDIATHILLTKADKLKFGQRKTMFLKVRKEIEKFNNSGSLSLQLFSSKDRLGIKELEQRLASWYLA